MDGNPSFESAAMGWEDDETKRAENAAYDTTRRRATAPWWFEGMFEILPSMLRNFQSCFYIIGVDEPEHGEPTSMSV